tara:strand:- start:702 stop:842 length:141 start_codon:yes stop_codon:yes gene_type:complete
MGERYNGIVEVVGSIPSGSTTNFEEGSFSFQNLSWQKDELLPMEVK